MVGKGEQGKHHEQAGEGEEEAQHTRSMHPWQSWQQEADSPQQTKQERLQQAAYHRGTRKTWVQHGEEQVKGGEGAQQE